MSERVSGFVIALENEISEEDAQHVADILYWIKNVVSVRPVTANIDQQLALMRSDSEWRHRILKLAAEVPR